MNVKSLVPAFYFKNYHSFILLSSIIFLILSIPSPTVDDWSLNGMRYLFDYPIMLFLTLLVVSNIALYSKSFISKSYPSIQESMSDFFNVYCVYVAIILKIMFQLLCVSYYINENNMIKFPSAEWMLGTMALFYFLSLLSIGHFVFHSVRGTYKRYKTPADNHHWIVDYISSKQLSKIKNISSKGKVVSVYFSGFF